MSLDYDSEEWVPWYIRDSARWLSLSLAARGAQAEIIRKLDKKGRLRLRRLEDLAVLLRVRWEGELEPAMGELLASGRVLYSEDAGVLEDPDFAARSRRAAAAERQRQSRLLRRARDPRSEQEAEEKRGEERRQIVTVTDVSEVTQVTTVTPSHAPGERPPWFDQAIEVIAMNTGVTLAPGEAWLRYDGHRAGKGIAPTVRDAQYWLTTVMVPEQREVKRRESRDVARDAGFKAERAALLPKAPKPENSTKLFKEREQWARDAGAPDPEAQARLNKLLGKVGSS